MSFKEFKRRLTIFILKNDSHAKPEYIKFDCDGNNIARYNGMTFVGNRSSEYVGIMCGEKMDNTTSMSKSLNSRRHLYRVRLLSDGTCVAA